MNNKDVFNQIVECLAIIAENPNVYSKSLVHEITVLSEMINTEEDSDETQK